MTFRQATKAFKETEFWQSEVRKVATWTDKRLWWNDFAQWLFDSGQITEKQLYSWGQPDCVTMPSERIKRPARFKIKTIDLSVKEWFDKVNGNSYFGAIMTLNYQMPDERTISLPFQYGYGEHSKQMAAAKLKELGYKFKGTWPVFHSAWMKENKIIFRYTKKENCLKKDVINWGKE